MEATTISWGYIGIMGKKMEATMIYWGLATSGAFRV